MSTRTWAVAFVLVSSIAAAPEVSAQTRAGGEFRVNTYTTGQQLYPSVGRDSRGNFVVVWDERHDYFVKGQRYDRAGTRVGAEFAVNSAGYSYYPAVAMSPRGNFVVVWTEYSDGDLGGIRGQRFNAAAARVGADFQVNTHTTSRQLFPNIALDGQENFVVTWWSYDQDGDVAGIFGQRFDAQANRRGAEFRVNTYTTGDQFFQDISSDSAGNFVVAWTSDPGADGSGYSVNGQRFDSAGTPQGAQFQINSYTTGNQLSVGVAHAPDGTFVIGFMSNQIESYLDVIAKRYSASGNPIGGEFLVNTVTTGQQGYPDIAMDSVGNFVVSWEGSNDGSSYGMFARRFRADGTPRGDAFLVNTYTTGSQSPNRMASTIASDGVGNFIVNWSGPTPAALRDVFAQRYGGLHPNALQVDTAGNGVFEPGETVDARPAWFNANGAAQAFGGTLANMTGPAGATYTINDGVANYGTVANNASAPCTDCYAVAVSNPTTRPAIHWDASALESITPDTQGQLKRWALHIGGSFTDVPANNGFYRFIETVFHHGITGGCTPTQYCPNDPATREQMAVFVLVAREGTGYVPPACTTPVFADVPASSPFCRWIEELARRGVVSGCGGGNYCPASSVTREQMAVFVLRMLDPAINPPACGTPVYNDVPASSPFCRWIEELTRRGVVTGCGGGNYCPTAPVTRGQMAVFISVTFGLTLYGP